MLPRVGPRGQRRGYAGSFPSGSGRRLGVGEALPDITYADLDVRLGCAPVPDAPATTRALRLQQQSRITLRVELRRLSIGPPIYGGTISNDLIFRALRELDTHMLYCYRPPRAPLVALPLPRRFGNTGADATATAQETESSAVFGGSSDSVAEPQRYSTPFCCRSSASVEMRAAAFTAARVRHQLAPTPPRRFGHEGDHRCRCCPESRIARRV